MGDLGSRFFWLVIGWFGLIGLTKGLEKNQPQQTVNPDHRCAAGLGILEKQGKVVENLKLTITEQLSGCIMNNSFVFVLSYKNG